MEYRIINSRRVHTMSTNRTERIGTQLEVTPASLQGIEQTQPPEGWRLDPRQKFQRFQRLQTTDHADGWAQHSGRSATERWLLSGRIETVVAAMASSTLTAKIKQCQ